MDSAETPLLVGAAWIDAIRKAGDIEAALAECERLSSLATSNYRRAIEAETQLTAIKAMLR